MKRALRFIKFVALGWYLIAGSTVAQAHCGDQLVTSLVNGLYESIPIERKFVWAGLEFASTRRTSRLRIPTTLIKTYVRNVDNEMIATAETIYSPDRRQMVANYVNTIDHFSSRTDMPSFVDPPGIIPLVPGRGIPTPLFLFLHQMKIAGVGFGQLQQLFTSRITNLMTAFELGNRYAIAFFIREHPGVRVPLHLIAQEFWTTNTGRFLATVITQSGGQILDAEFSGGSIARVEDLYAGRVPHARLVRAQGHLSMSHLVPYNFTLSVQVGPAAIAR